MFWLTTHACSSQAAGRVTIQMLCDQVLMYVYCSAAGKGHKKRYQNILTTTEVSLIKFATTVAYRNKLLAILLHSTVYRYTYLAYLALMFLVFSTFYIGLNKNCFAVLQQILVVTRGRPDVHAH